MSIRIKHHNSNVWLMQGGDVLLDLSWQEAEEMRKVMRTRPAVNRRVKHRGTNYQIIVENDKVQIFSRRGILLFEIPEPYVKRTLDALTSVCRLAESHDLAVINAMIEDQSLMQRAGVPFGLTDNKKIQDEIMKEAHYNKKLRKYVLPKVMIETPMGVPKITQTTPEDRIKRIITGGTEREKAILREAFGNR